MDKNKFYILHVIILVVLTNLSAFSQERQLEKAQKAYDNFGYLNARNIYLKVVERGYESQELYTKIANSYYFNAKYDDALMWYDKIFELEDYELDSRFLLHYAQSLKATGNIKKSEIYYDKFVDISGKSLKSVKLTSEKYLELIEDNSGRYEIKSIEGVNTENIEYGKTLIGGKLFFTSNRSDGLFKIRKNTWDGMAFLDIYQVDLNNDKEAISKPEKLPGDVNGKYHASSPIITKDGETMYFTKSNFNPEEKKNDENLKIYRAHLIDGEWTNVEDLSINDDHYSTAHPALDSLESTLYFSSNMPGGYGKSDIYKVTIDENDVLGEPENLGAKVNTLGKETFPFISNSEELYFSSDGHFGLGGMDVFYIKITENGLENLLNVGEPINSYADDFAFAIKDSTKNGFFSSNRKLVQNNDQDETQADQAGQENEFINDNIYSLKELEPIQDVYKAIIEGHVTDAETEEPITDALVELFEDNDSLYKSVNTDKEGYYHVEVDFFSAYRLRASKENYDSEEDVSVPEKKEQKIDFELQKNRLKLTPGVDIAHSLNIQNILFDFDKYNIKDSEKLKLEKLLVVLEEYPEVKIKIHSHTDSRGSHAYNQELSQKRAHSTREYLIDKGVDPSRLTSKGFGETQLVNKCSDNVTCSEEEHEKNRRSEFIIAN